MWSVKHHRNVTTLKVQDSGKHEGFSFWKKKKNSQAYCHKPQRMALVLLAASQTCKDRGVHSLPFCLHASLPQRQKSYIQNSWMLFLPLRLHWFLTNRRSSFLISRVKVAISLTIIFTYKLGNQGIPLPRPQDWHTHRGTTPLALNQFTADLATKQHFFRSQHCQETMLKQVVEPVPRDTKEWDDNQ